MENSSKDSLGDNSSKDTLSDSAKKEEQRHSGTGNNVHDKSKTTSTVTNHPPKEDVGWFKKIIYNPYTVRVVGALIAAGILFVLAQYKTEILKKLNWNEVTTKENEQ